MSLAMNRPLPEAATPPSIPNALAGFWEQVYHEFENNQLFLKAQSSMPSPRYDTQLRAALEELLRIPLS